MRIELGSLLRAAFNARPIGMFVPPNWVGLSAFGLLGLLNPGFWLVGAGLELAYLYVLVNHPRFHRYVSGTLLQSAQRAWQHRVERTLEQLSPADQATYQALEQRCRTILEQQREAENQAGLAAQGEGLGRLLWIFLRLLATRSSIQSMLRENLEIAEGPAPSGSVRAKAHSRATRTASAADIDQRIAALKTRLEDPALGADLRKSLTGQLEILAQRRDRQREAGEKLAFLDAELTRIQEQVELIREQAVLTTDAGAVSERIDQVAATLGGTIQWIQEQQQVYGKVEDLLDEPKPVLLPAVAKESQ